MYILSAVIRSTILLAPVHFADPDKQFSITWRILLVSTHPLKIEMLYWKYNYSIKLST